MREADVFGRGACIWDVCAALAPADEVEESGSEGENHDYEDDYHGNDTRAYVCGSGFGGSGGTARVRWREDGAYLLWCAVLPETLADGEIAAFVVYC